MLCIFRFLCLYFLAPTCVWCTRVLKCRFSKLGFQQFIKVHPFISPLESKVSSIFCHLYDPPSLPLAYLSWLPGISSPYGYSGQPVTNLLFLLYLTYFVNKGTNKLGVVVVVGQEGEWEGICALNFDCTSNSVWNCARTWKLTLVCCWFSDFSSLHTSSSSANLWMVSIKMFLTLSLPSVINFKCPCTLTRNITSHSMKNLDFHSLVRIRWKMINYTVLPILTTVFHL